MSTQSDLKTEARVILDVIEAWAELAVEKAQEDLDYARALVRDISDSGAYAIANIESLAVAQRDLAHAEAALAEAEAAAGVATDPRALFAYLAGIVLPKVERDGVSDKHRTHFAAGSRKVSVFRPHVNTSHAGYLMPFSRQEFTTAEDMRALAACLLAAADEAEGEK